MCSEFPKHFKGLHVNETGPQALGADLHLANSNCAVPAEDQRMQWIGH